MELILAGTGHRPKLLGGYGQTAKKALLDFAKAMIEKHKPTQIISGMALGWDQALALAAIDAEIPFIAAIPFDGQEKAWPKEAQKTYDDIVAKADRKVVVCEGEYCSWKMMARNEWMVNRCNKMLALWNGKSSGTGNCVEYAKDQGKEIINCWEDWRFFNETQ